MSILRRRADERPAELGHDAPPAPLTRAERKARRAEEIATAELAARVARANRRLAQATGPLPVARPRRSSDERVRES